MSREMSNLGKCSSLDARTERVALGLRDRNAAELSTMEALDERTIIAPKVDQRSSRCARFAPLWKRDWPRFLILALTGFLVRLPALQGQFVWDDEFLARDNPFIKSPLLILEAFRHYLFPDSYSGHYRPVQNISFIFDYYFWNNNPYGFHLTNLLLHVASGLLLYCLLRKLFRSLLRSAATAVTPRTASLLAFFVALLWMVHPVHSAAIDYISGRADSLAFLFACGGWLLVLRAQGVPSRLLRPTLYGAAILCGLLALCSREIAGIWFALFLLHSFFFEKKISHRVKLVSLGCCLVLIAIYAGLRQLPERRPGAGPSNSLGAPTRAALVLRALGDYGRLMVFPSNLHMERSVFDGSSYRNDDSWKQSAALQYLSIAGLLVLAIGIYGSCRKGPAQRLRIFGASWFLLGFLPISNIFDLGATAAEHWLYLPSVGFLMFAAGCIIDLPSRYRKISMALACLAVAGLSARSIVRSSDWITQETFFRRTLAAGGASTRVIVNLAQIYASHGDYGKAEVMYRKVLQITPDYPIARNNLAEVLSREGKTKEAEKLLAMTSTDAAEDRKNYPLTWIAALNLARLQHKQKNDKGALATLEKARADYPRTWEIIGFEAEVLRETRGPDAALQLVENFARANWWHYGAAVALGRLYAEKGDSARAEAALRHASRLDVHDANALNLIAMISVRQNRLQNACAAQRQAVARQPDEPRQYVLLSNILEKMGRTSEARSATAQVTRLQLLAQAQPVIAN